MDILVAFIIGASINARGNEAYMEGFWAGQKDKNKEPCSGFIERG